MKKNILLIFVLLSLSCIKRVENTKDIVFEIENTKIKPKDLLTIKIVNKTRENYFIILDTNRINDYMTLNYKINNSIHLKPKLFSNKDSIKLKIEFSLYKLANEDTLSLNCIQKERSYTLKIMHSIKKLNNIVIIRKNSVFKFNIPFDSSFSDCSRKYSYSLKKGEKYYLQFEYKMDKKLINEIVDDIQMMKLRKSGINPCFEKISSNIVEISPSWFE